MYELKFDSNALFLDFVDKVIIPSANEAIKRVHADIKKGIIKNRKEAKHALEDIEVEKAIMSEEANAIVAKVVSYGWAVIESYGTGQKMDFTNKALTDYVQDGILWNPARYGFDIVGRPKGPYTNIFGEETKSEGNREGIGIGGWGKGLSPSYAIQNAEKRLEQGLDGGYVDRILETNTEKFFDTVDMDKYFIEVET